jgi:hypothetical protein
MSGTSKIPFSKPWLSYPDQVQLLQQRGLKTKRGDYLRVLSDC